MLQTIKSIYGKYWAHHVLIRRDTVKYCTGFVALFSTLTNKTTQVPTSWIVIFRGGKLWKNPILPYIQIER